jgi:hypothetical protein
MNTIVLLMKVLLISYTCLLVLLVPWVLKGRIPRAYYSKYSPKLIHRSSLPFAEAWRSDVEASDLPIFLRARMRTHVLGLAGMIHFYILLTYLLVQTEALCARARGG